MGIVLSFGLSVSFFTLVLLSFKMRETNKRSYGFAMLIVGLWFIRFLLWYLKKEVDLSEVPWLFFIDQNLFFLDGVFLLWYVKSLGDWRFTFKKEFFHLIPFILSCVITMKAFLWVSKLDLNLAYQAAVSEVQTQTVAISWEELVIILGTIAHAIVYSLYSLKRTREHQKSLKSRFSSIDKFAMNWMVKFIFLWLTLTAIPVVLYFINYLIPVIDIMRLEKFLLISLVLADSYFCLFVVNQYYANSGSSNVVTETVKEQKELEMLEGVFQTLQGYMVSHKPYLQEGLTLQELSDSVGVPANSISSAIKECGHSNFYNYVNGYRIEEVKRELISSNEQVIIIAYKNGFQSKSTFNKVFKEYTGYSPSDYRKRHKTVK